MLGRRQSDNRPPAPAYMNNQQMSDYLSNLRTSRPTRPTGARPPPSTFRSNRPSLPVSSMVDVPEHDGEAQPNPKPIASSMSSRRVSGHKKASSMSHIGSVSSRLGSHSSRPLVRSPLEHTANQDHGMGTAYQESGARWMEKQEARSLRIALQEMDTAGEQQLFEAAQQEASELVWKHQNPKAPEADSHTPYRYRGHLEQGSVSKRVAWEEDGIIMSKCRIEGRSKAGSRSASDGSDSAATSSSSGSRVPSDGSARSTASIASRSSRMRRRSLQFASSVLKKGEEKLSGIRVPSLKKAFSTVELKSHDEKTFNDSGIVESSKDSAVLTSKATALSGSVHARNPFSRVRNARSSIFRSEEHKQSSSTSIPFRERVEIQRNPPSQSRNAEYTTTTPRPIKDHSESVIEDVVKLKDGKEIRDDDIRKATSMSLKDRSPKLPTPTMVSDAPGRPIVSFKNDWAPKQVELKQEYSAKMSPSTSMGSYSPTIPTIAVSEPLPVQSTRSSRSPMTPAINHKADSRAETAMNPSIVVARMDQPMSQTRSNPSIPTISLPEDTNPNSSTNSISSLASNGTPSLSISPPAISISAPPTISISAPPTINISTPAVAVSPPIISINGDKSAQERPLPTPSRAKKQRPQWAVPTQANMRSSVLCNECAMPIAGRIVTAAGVRFHPACFRCHHCSEALECVAFFPEPDHKRAERLASAAELDEPQDDSTRFYCHLDYHEFFSPRCKSCKTPIEGDVVVACGAEWHAGHFFCAQCGDPFEQSTPYVEKDGYAWCVNCHTNRFSTKCKKCRKPVVDTVLKALGGEWHEDCFCCHECGDKFSDGRYFLREGEEDPVCPACEERRLKA